MADKQMFKPGKQSLMVWLPAVGLLGSALLPMKPVFSQVMIGIGLVWFQVSLMLGYFA